MQDLSNLLPGGRLGALTVTSQAGGNMLAENDQAMTAPGSEPVDNLQNHLSQVKEEPQMKASGPVIPPATSGKPQASEEKWTPPGEPAWKKVSPPEVVRKPAGTYRPPGL